MQQPPSISLGYMPRPWQSACHRRPERFQVYALHRRAGKTVQSTMKLIHCAAFDARENPVYAYVAPFRIQAKAIAWGPLKARLAPLITVGRVDVSEGELFVRFQDNGAMIRLFGADNPDAMRGLGLAGLVVDEVAGIKPEVWYEILRPTLADWGGWAQFIGTPHGVDLFSEIYRQAERASDWHARTWTVYETDALPEEEIVALHRGMTTNAFAREFLCDFTASGDDQLISLCDSMEASKRAYVERDVMHAPRVLGVDPARFGDDRSVIVKRQGLQMFDPIVFMGIDNMQLAARVAAVIAEWTPQAVFIDAGAGAGVIDRLRQLGHAVSEVPFGGQASKPTLFLNRRAEMWWEMAEWLRGGGAIPDNPELVRELATPIYWYDPAGRKVLEPKDKIKERLPGAGSPDIADALALTFAHPVHVREVLPPGVRRPSRRDWDPYRDWGPKG